MAPSIDEFEDLTQFADESFDTEEVDLFEFSDDEDSPLLRLKSIVLSLDWEITEETLAELGTELTSLRDLWKDDKVAQIYLQGMENVGKYLRVEGAYAHPNAIKLLLTLYSNFEKIISSPEVSDEIVTALVKADIRKFKVLQYQISMGKAGQEEMAVEEAELPEPKKAVNPLHSMEATILGLEWEVTDEGLEKFHAEATELRRYLSDNSDAQVLVQGLQALGAYIRQQKSEAHPDAFTILHSFYDALKSLLENKELTAEQRRQILVEQISSLNSLKDIIARSAVSGGASAAEAEDEESSLPEEEGKAAVSFEEEGGSAQLPEPELEEAPSAAGKDDLDLDRFFTGTVEEDDSSPVGGQSFFEPDAAAAGRRPGRGAAPAAEDEEDEELDDLFADGPEGGKMVTPALADEDEIGGFSGSAAAANVSEDRAAELDEKLNSFFEFEGDGPAPKAEAEPSGAAPAVESRDAAPAAKDEEDFEEGEIADKSEDELDSFFNFDEEEDWDKQAAAVKVLSPEDQEKDGPPAKDEEDFEEGEIADRSEDELDSFFNFDEEEDWDKQAAAVASPAVEPDDQELGAEEEGEEDAAAGIDSERAAEITEKLDSFFNFDEELGAVREKAEAAALPEADADERPGGAAPDRAEAAALPDDEIDSFFNLDEELGGGLEKAETAALLEADADELPGGAASDKTEAAAPPDDEVDSFFNLGEGLNAGQEETAAAAPPEVEAAGLPAGAAPDKAEAAAPPDDEIDSFFALAAEEEDAASVQELDEEFITALDDADDEPAGSAPGRAAAPDLSPAVPAAGEADDEDGLDAFFAFDDEDRPAERPQADDEDGLPGGGGQPVAADEEEDEFALFFGDDDAPAAPLDEDEEDAADRQQTEAFSPFEDDDFPGAMPDAGEEDHLFHFEGGRTADKDAAPALPAAEEEDEPFGLDEEFVLTEDDEESPPGRLDAGASALERDEDECPVQADEFDAFQFGGVQEAPAEEVPALAEARVNAALSSLAAAAAVFSSAPSAKVLRQVTELAAEVRAANIVPPHQAIVLTLLDSSAALIAKAPEADGSAIVRDLASGLEQAEDPAVLADIVGRYTAWQQDFFDKVIGGMEAAKPAEAGLYQLQEGVINLKETIMAEFSQLRKELKAAAGGR